MLVLLLCGLEAVAAEEEDGGGAAAAAAAAAAAVPSTVVGWGLRRTVSGGGVTRPEMGRNHATLLLPLIMALQFCKSADFYICVSVVH